MQRRFAIAAMAAAALIPLTGAAQAPAPLRRRHPNSWPPRPKEGKVVLYSATDVKVAEKLASAFEAKYRHQGAGGAGRGRAALPAHQPGVRSKIYAVDV